jgi:WD40 repeat protein
VILLEATTTDTGSTYRALLYSLTALQIIQTIDFGSIEVDTVKSSTTTICISGPESLMVYSAIDLSPFTSFSDVWETQAVGPVVFDIASRSIAYATSTPLQSQIEEDMFHMDDYKLKNVGKKATEIAQKVGKELVDGMQVMGGRGYQAISNYFNGEEKECEKLNPQDGIIMIRKLQLPNHPVLCHFKAHRNPLVNITFSPSQTMLLTASLKGNNIYVWSLMNCFQSQQQPNCVMKFARGYTSALITHLSMSIDSKWVSCSTSRGTTHLYQADLGNSKTSPCCRIHSRSSIQVVKSILSTDGESLGTSPLVKPSSSMDHATSDLGYDDIFFDTFKNISKTTLLPIVQNKIHCDGTELYQKRLPILCWNPFGKLTLVQVEITQQLDSSKLGIKQVCTPFSQYEWSVCRSLDWEQSTESVMIFN